MKLPDSEKNKYKFVFDLSVETGLLNVTFHSLPFSPSMVVIDSCLMESKHFSIGIMLISMQLNKQQIDTCHYQAQISEITKSQK